MISSASARTLIITSRSPLHDAVGLRGTDLCEDAQYGRCVRVTLHLLSVMCRLASHFLVHIGATTSWTTNAPSCSRRRHSLASMASATFAFALAPVGACSSSISLRSSVRTWTVRQTEHPFGRRCPNDKCQTQRLSRPTVEQFAS